MTTAQRTDAPLCSPLLLIAAAMTIWIMHLPVTAAAAVIGAVVVLWAVDVLTGRLPGPTRLAWQIICAVGIGSLVLFAEWVDGWAQ